MFRPRHLDLSRPADEPLDPSELAELRAHLAFLKRWKASLRLSLNAQEDRAVNGEQPLSERGAAKHLLAKLDRATIEKALAREPLSRDPAERARFLVGVIRVDPDPELLLRYLDALAAGGERREAAATLPEAVARLDFARLGARGVAQILEPIRRLFEGHDRVQVLFGLLGNDSFRAHLADFLPSLDPELAAAFGPLLAAHRAVFEGTRADEDADDRAILDGLERILSAPEPVLRSYPEPVRARLAALAMELGSESREAVRRLMHGLPLKDPAYLELRRARVEQLLREASVDEARALVNQVGAEAPWAAPLKSRLGGRLVGRAVVGPPLAEGSRLLSALWLDKPGPAIARVASPADAGTLAFEARLQSELAIPMLTPVLASGLAADGNAFLVLAPLGGPFSGPAERWPLEARLQVALEVARLAALLADKGLVLPDLAPGRFLSNGGRLSLADLSGLSREEPGRASMTLAPHATRFAARMLEGVEAPRGLARRLRGATPLALLSRALAEAL